MKMNDGIRTHHITIPSESRDGSMDNGDGNSKITHSKDTVSNSRPKEVPQTKKSIEQVFRAMNWKNGLNHTTPVATRVRELQKQDSCLVGSSPMERPHDKELRPTGMQGRHLGSSSSCPSLAFE
jgi:hypothetical protein